MKRQVDGALGSGLHEGNEIPPWGRGCCFKLATKLYTPLYKPVISGQSHQPAPKTVETEHMLKSLKIVAMADLSARLRGHREAGRSIVFTNGCFDILHAGHVRYLAAAKAQGDILVVGLNSDASVRIIKGPDRPIVGETDRAEVLAALVCVDHVTLFHEPDPLRLIHAARPDVLVKGADWTEDRIIGADLVKKNGGRVFRVPVVPDISTTEIIGRIRESYCPEQSPGGKSSNG